MKSGSMFSLLFSKILVISKNEEFATSRNIRIAKNQKNIKVKIFDSCLKKN